MDDAHLSAIVGQLRVEDIPNLSLFAEDEPFDPMPGVYRAARYGPTGPIFVCYGRASEYGNRKNVVAVVLQLDEYAPSVDGRGAWAPGVDRRTQFLTKEQWNEKAMEWIDSISEGLRELGWV